LCGISNRGCCVRSFLLFYWMSTEKGVGVKIGEESYLTSYGCGETIDGLLNRVNQTLGVSHQNARLYVVGESDENKTLLPKQPDISLNFNKDLNTGQSLWVSSLFIEVDNLILHLRPTIKSLMARKVVLEYIKKNLSKCLGARVFCIGSSMNNIFLPNETIEVTPFLCKGLVMSHFSLTIFRSRREMVPSRKRRIVLYCNGQWRG
jgi:hypothetical protein